VTRSVLWDTARRVTVHEPPRCTRDCTGSPHRRLPGVDPLRSPRVGVLFVCTGNSARSPIAEALQAPADAKSCSPTPQATSSNYSNPPTGRAQSHTDRSPTASAFDVESKANGADWSRPASRLQAARQASMSGITFRT
jgi:Low molecular weight phosphotyrosine protein phosphatase